MSSCHVSIRYNQKYLVINTKTLLFLLFIAV